MLNQIITGFVPKQFMALGVTAALSLAAFNGQSALLLEETFNNGMPEGTPSFTSDGNGFWFGQLGVYGGTPENPNYYMLFDGMSFSVLDFPAGSATGVRDIENYSINIGTVQLGGEWTSGAVSYVMFCTRKNSTTLGFGYEFRPDTVDENNKPTAWKVSYQPAQGTPAIKVATFPGESPILSHLEIRVFGNQMRLYTNGIPVDPVLRATQGAPGESNPDEGGFGDYQRALEIICNTTGGHIVEATIDDLTITTPEPQPPFEDTSSGTTLVYEGFNYEAGTDLNEASPGGMGWLGPYMLEQNASLVFLSALSATTEAPGLSYGDLIVEGNHASLIAPGTAAPDNSRRSLRWIDIDNFPAEFKSDNGMVVRQTGKQIWLSVLAQRLDTSKAGFFGVALYSNMVETVFLGKSGAANETNWRVEGKSPNTTGLTTINADSLAFLVLLIEWDYDGSVNEAGRPLTPDTMHLWVNPDLNSEPSKEAAAAISIRDVNVATQNPHLYFNRVGFRGLNSGGVLDEFRIGTTFRSVAPIPGVGEPEAPELSVSLEGGNVQIRWKTTEGFVLKSTSDLTNPVWTDASGTLTFDGDDSVMTIAIDAAASFFQLVK